MDSARNYGWIKGKNDDRDYLIKFSEKHMLNFAKVKNLSLTKNDPVFDLRKIVNIPQGLNDIDQGKLGSCTANAIAFAYAFDEIKQSNKEVFLPSRLFIYYNERLIEGTVNNDSGAEIRDGIKSINKYGVCDEHHWIYDPTQFTIKPPDSVYNEAKSATAVKYAKIDFTDDRTITDKTNRMKMALQSGFPFVFGFVVYESFESEKVAKTGMVPMPKTNEKVMGGHAVCAVGFDDTKQCFIVKNSWGANWGLDSYFYMPYQYMSDSKLCDDFWIIQQVTNPDNIIGFTTDDINPDAKNLDVDINANQSSNSYCLII